MDNAIFHQSFNLYQLFGINLHLITNITYLLYNDNDNNDM